MFSNEALDAPKTQIVHCTVKCQLPEPRAYAEISKRLTDFCLLIGELGHWQGNNLQFLHALGIVDNSETSPTICHAMQIFLCL